MAVLNFGGPIELLRNSLDGSGLNHAAIANNIANVNTPNFRRSTVPFKAALAASQAPVPDDNELYMVTTDAKHIGGLAQPVPYSTKAEIDESTQMRVDKSNVDLDQEMAQLAENASYSQTQAQMLTIQYTRLREAITGIA